MEVGRIVAAALSKGERAPADKTYLSQWVAARTGLNRPTPTSVSRRPWHKPRRHARTRKPRRVRRRKPRASGGVPALAGLRFDVASGFCASYAATIGGSQRDSIAVV